MTLDLLQKNFIHNCDGNGLKLSNQKLNAIIYLDVSCSVGLEDIDKLIETIKKYFVRI